jgi:hypothetical protein
MRAAPSDGGRLAEAALRGLKDGDLAKWRLLQECRRLVVLAHLEGGHLPMQCQRERRQFAMLLA